MRSHFREYGLPLLLLGASVVTTTANGARFMQNFVEGMPPVVRDSDLWPWGWLFDHPAMFKAGWAFSASLLGILLIHEFGHYFACRWHKIRATLPMMLPAPTLSGTMGAVIQIRSRIPTRSALMDVGVYGPLAGYVASVAAVAVGLSAQRIYQDLVCEHGFAGSYQAVKRFVRHLRQTQPIPFVRMEVEPGAEAQVDFGQGAWVVVPGFHPDELPDPTAEENLCRPCGRGVR